MCQSCRARARPVPGLAGLDAARKRLGVHMRDHQQLARRGIGGDAGDEAVGVEARRKNVALFERMLVRGRTGKGDMGSKPDRAARNSASVACTRAGAACARLWLIASAAKQSSIAGRGRWTSRFAAMTSASQASPRFHHREEADLLGRVPEHAGILRRHGRWSPASARRASTCTYARPRPARRRREASSALSITCAICAVIVSCVCRRRA